MYIEKWFALAIVLFTIAGFFWYVSEHPGFLVSY